METTMRKPNKESRMAARIIRHGESLLEMFPNATIREPLALCKALRRLELEVSNLSVKNCNEGVGDEIKDAKVVSVTKRLCKALGITETELSQRGFFVNWDPRGYALKFGDAQTNQHNRAAKIPLHRDWGGYGIIAPDLTED